MAHKGEKFATQKNKLNIPMFGPFKPLRLLDSIDITIISILAADPHHFPKFTTADFLYLVKVMLESTRILFFRVHI